MQVGSIYLLLVLLAAELGKIIHVVLVLNIRFY